MYLLTNLFNTIKRWYNESDCATVSAYESIYMHDEPVVVLPKLKKVYKDHVTPNEMIIDGWARGFRKQQTIDEMFASGYVITEQELQQHWDTLTNQMNNNQKLSIEYKQHK